MKQIEDTDLTELAKEATTELIVEQRNEARNLIRSLFQRRIALAEEGKRKEAELAKLKKKLESTDARIARLRAGDWSVLSEKEQGEKEEPASQAS